MRENNVGELVWKIQTLQLVVAPTTGNSDD